MATKTYIVAENWGKGFIEHSESAKFTISGLPGNVWQVPAHNKDANLWINKVLGVVKTKAEAQAIVDAEVLKAQQAWDLLSDEEKARSFRPADITLVE
jgi:hypothetical protein